MHCVCQAPHEAIDVVFSFSCNWDCDKVILEFVSCYDLRTHESIETWTSPLQENVLVADLKATLVWHKTVVHDIYFFFGDYMIFSSYISTDCIVTGWTEGVKWARCWDWRSWEYNRRGWSSCQANRRLDLKLSDCWTVSSSTHRVLFCFQVQSIIACCLGEHIPCFSANCVSVNWN